MKTFVRETARQMFHGLGGNALVRFQRRHQPRVLMYHRFPPGSEAELERQCAHISRRYHAIGLDDLLVWREGQMELPPNSVMVTIDDGYRDFYTTALPIFSRHQIPTLMFPAADFLDGDWLWFDRVVYAIRHTTLRAFQTPVESRELSLAPDQRAYSQAWFLAALMRAPQDARLAALDQLSAIFDVEIPHRPTADYEAMHWDEMRDSLARGVTFGGHTCSHPVMSRLTFPQLLHEVTECKRRLEQQLGRPVKSFAYPFGGADETSDLAAKAVAEAGYALALTSLAGFVDRSGDRWWVPRIPAGPEQKTLYFQQQIAGFRLLRG
jgi:peptidoglycan/xylan/chitin deacetylase (PgdA/CDA1 family)